jgi:drug/metabolite transporter (DMT)-like permease
VTGVLLALGSSASWAALDGLRKRLGRDLSASALVVSLSLGQGLLFVVLWIATGAEVPGVDYAPFGAALLVMNLVANLLFVRAVQLSALSVTVPFLSFTPAFSAALGIPVLGQIPSPGQVSGIALVVLGGAVLASRDHPDDPPRWKDPGVWMMLATAALWGSTTALDAHVVKTASPMAHGLVQTGGMGVVLIVIGFARRRSRDLIIPAASRRLTVVAIVVACTAYALQLFALTVVWAAVMETIKRVVGVWAALFVGRAAFGEAVTPRKLIAATLMAAGTAALALAG